MDPPPKTSDMKQSSVSFKKVSDPSIFSQKDTDKKPLKADIKGVRSGTLNKMFRAEYQPC